MFYLFFILFLLSLSSVFAQFRIVGGEQVTSLKEVPFIISFNATDDQNSNGIFCSGVLISCRTIITAAHCLINRSVAYIRLGSLQYGSGGQVVISHQFIIHPQYNPATQENDIALLFLATEPRIILRKRSNFYQKRKFFHSVQPPKGVTCNWPIAENEYACEIKSEEEEPSSSAKIIASPICLPSSNTQQTQIYLNTCLLTVAGWGQPEYLVQFLSPILQSITVASIPIATCYRLYSENTKGSNNELLLARFTAPGADRRILCAHWPGKAICLGDSGGALFTQIKSSSAGHYSNLNPNSNPNNNNSNPKFILLGIASETLECGRNGVPDIYTRVDAYLNWISANTL